MILSQESVPILESEIALIRPKNKDSNTSDYKMEMSVGVVMNTDQKAEFLITCVTTFVMQIKVSHVELSI